MKNIGYYNGVVDLQENICIPMLDRANYFGDGCYDALYSRNYRPYCLGPHIERLYSSASMLDITPPMTKGEMTDLIGELMKKCDSGDLFIYIQLSRGTGPRSHVYTPDMKSNLWITMTPKSVENTYVPTKCITVPDTRFYHCNIKTIDLLPNVMAATKAHHAGAHEAIFFRESSAGSGDGIVTEGTHSNVHAIIDGVFRTHPTDEQILPGIARANIISACRRLGIPYSEQPFTRSDLFRADEVIISSSGSFCIPVSEIDGIKVGRRGGDILKKLQDELVRDWTECTAE